MSDGYDYDKTFNSEKLTAELIIRVTALENLLIEKQLITDDELKNHYSILADKIINMVNATNEFHEIETTKALNAYDQEAEFNDLLRELNIDPHKISKGN